MSEASGRFGPVAAENLTTVKKVQSYLCSMAAHSIGRKKEYNPEACKSCESPCAYGKKWIEMLEKAEKKKDKQSEKNAAPEASQLEEELKRTKDALAVADGEASRAQSEMKGAEKRLEAAMAEIAELKKMLDERQKLLEIVRQERDTAERESCLNSKLWIEAQEKLEKEHARRQAAEQANMRLKAALWDMEHPSAGI